MTTERLAQTTWGHLGAFIWWIQKGDDFHNYGIHWNTEGSKPVFTRHDPLNGTLSEKSHCPLHWIFV